MSDACSRHLGRVPESSKTQIQNDIRRCRRTLLDPWKLIGKQI